MKRMLLTISYDGTAYHGWQVQPNGITVQQTLQDSLEKLLGEDHLLPVAVVPMQAFMRAGFAVILIVKIIFLKKPF